MGMRMRMSQTIMVKHSKHCFCNLKWMKMVSQMDYTFHAQFHIVLSSIHAVQKYNKFQTSTHSLLPSFFLPLLSFFFLFSWRYTRVNIRLQKQNILWPNLASNWDSHRHTKSPSVIGQIQSLSKCAYQWCSAEKWTGQNENTVRYFRLRFGGVCISRTI